MVCCAVGAHSVESEMYKHPHYAQSRFSDCLSGTEVSGLTAGCSHRRSTRVHQSCRMNSRKTGTAAYAGDENFLSLRNGACGAQHLVQAPKTRDTVSVSADSGCVMQAPGQQPKSIGIDSEHDGSFLKFHRRVQTPDCFSV